MDGKYLVGANPNIPSVQPYPTLFSPSHSDRPRMLHQFTMDGPTPAVNRPRTLLDGPMNVPSLPLELIDAIAGDLFDTREKMTLSSMSITCHSWLHLARRHLFKRVGMDYSKIAPFVEFLKTDHGSTICEYVQILFISGKSQDTSLATLESMLSKLTHLRSLSVHAFAFKKSSEDNLDLDSRETHLLRHRTKLDGLYVAELGISDDYVADFVAFLGLFSAIDNLGIDSAIWGEEAPFSLPAHGAREVASAYGENVLPHLRVNSLVLTQPSLFGTAFILELLRRGPPVHTITSLNVDCEYLDQCLSLFYFLEDGGSNILDLTFDIQEDLGTYFRMWQENVPKLKACTSLRSLKLRICVPNGVVDISDTSIWSRAIGVLALLPASIIRIHLELQGDLACFMQQFHAYEETMRLDVVLRRMPKLESVVLRLTFIDYEKGCGRLPESVLREAGDVFRVALQESQGRGVLKLIYS